MALGFSLEDFKNQTLGRSYGNPPPVLTPNQGTYIGQCVSYIRQYIQAVLGLPDQRVGNAITYWNSAYMNQYFDKVSGPLKDGDIMIWGNDPGSWTGPEGHIAISYGGKLLQQNGGNAPLKVSIGSSFSPGYLGAYRIKGGNDVITVKDFNTGADAAGFKWGKDFNYDQNMPVESFVGLLNGNAPIVTTEAEHALADKITGVKNVIGKDYNSPYVGKKVVDVYPQMVDFWITQRPPVAPPKPSQEYVPYVLPALFTKKEN